MLTYEDCKTIISNDYPNANVLGIYEYKYSDGDFYGIICSNKRPTGTFDNFQYYVDKKTLEKKNIMSGDFAVKGGPEKIDTLIFK